MVYESIVHSMLSDPAVEGVLVESRIVHTGDGVGGVVDLLVEEAPFEDVLSACATLVPPWIGAAAVVGEVECGRVVGLSEAGPVGALVRDPAWWEAALDAGRVVAPDDFAGFPDDLVAEARALGFCTAWAAPILDRSTNDTLGCLVVLSRVDVAFDLAADGNLRQAMRIASLAITEERRRRLLRHQAATDPLTGLGNRSALRRRLDAATGDVTLVAIDLDGFKPVNDVHGHATGDQVLQVVAERLRSVVREDDLVVRFGGDEFAVVLADDAPEEAAGKLVSRVVATLEAPIELEGLTLTIGASLGGGDRRGRERGARRRHRPLRGQAGEAGQARPVGPPGQAGGPLGGAGGGVTPEDLTHCQETALGPRRGMDGDRFRQQVDPAQAAVVTVELQRGVVEPGGVLPALAEAVQADGLLGRVGELCAAAREAGAHVVHCTAEFRPDGLGAAVNSRLMAVNARVRRDHGVCTTDIGTPGVEIVPEVGLAERDVVVPRMQGLTPFTATPLDQVLRNLGVRTVIATGVSLNLAIFGLVLSAVDLGYQVVLPRDGVVALPAAYGDAIIENSLSLVATVTTVDDIVRAWKGA